MTTGDTTTLEFSVTGMHCASCAHLIDETLEDLPGVEGSQTDHAEGRTVVRADPGVATADDIVAAIAGAGYKATPVASRSDE